MEIPFLDKFGPKNQNTHFMLKFGIETNSNMQNSMTLFSFFTFEWKYPFWAKLVQKIKILTLCWNLVLTLIRACRIQWWCPFFLFLIGNTLFGQISSKKSELSVEAEILVPGLIRICRIQWYCSRFLFLWEIPFFGEFGPKSQTYMFKLKFGT